MDCFEISVVNTQAQDPRGFVGGKPSLPVDSEWPACRMCRERLVHFLDLELPRSKDLLFKAGSRLQIFACREHDDIAGTIYSDYKRFATVTASRGLPKNYWNVTDGHYLIRLLSPSAAVVPAASGEARLALRNLELRQMRDSSADPHQSFKLFGYPFWVQDVEDHLCCCGAPMRLLLQVPDGFGFDMEVGAPEQANSFSHTQYCLFLGNYVYLLACEQQCHPLAILPVLQN
ncbi:hypothetical protein AYO40_04120 [Planctomycetaceae bacterium SCGC AG-212-D15]|nr:hypothetical protein AYO40_04120 [Planctomycetaceae bacterium SCGC AG-212-D15]